MPKEGKGEGKKRAQLSTVQEMESSWNPNSVDQGAAAATPNTSTAGRRPSSNEMERGLAEILGDSESHLSGRFDPAPQTSWNKGGHRMSSASLMRRAADKQWPLQEDEVVQLSASQIAGGAAAQPAGQRVSSAGAAARHNHGARHSQAAQPYQQIPTGGAAAQPAGQRVSSAGAAAAGQSAQPTALSYDPKDPKGSYDKLAKDYSDLSKEYKKAHDYSEKSFEQAQKQGNVIKDLCKKNVMIIDQFKKSDSEAKSLSALNVTLFQQNQELDQQNQGLYQHNVVLAQQNTALIAEVARLQSQPESQHSSGAASADSASPDRKRKDPINNKEEASAAKEEASGAASSGSNNHRNKKSRHPSSATHPQTGESVGKQNPGHTTGGPT